ncbi:hypothetical protein STRPO_0091 [Streptococcus porcinus str. Jelinkova 176]|uniref:Uncharacterized protein n=1 Tax=Streptococcus porcinus str. Jelinkova 176 TaxID=873448 RepID=A0ABP2KZM7_STRPO|nr:hypothetical protein STRPO_0091 [Streptococcus porcinus str. Jelinkova 176]
MKSDKFGHLIYIGYFKHIKIKVFASSFLTFKGFFYAQFEGQMILASI